MSYEMMKCTNWHFDSLVTPSSAIMLIFELKRGDTVFGCFGAVFLLKIGAYEEKLMNPTKDHLFPYPYL